MKKTLHVIINTEIEEFDYNISVLGVYSTLEGAVNTLHTYLKERFTLENIDSFYTARDKTEWDMVDEDFKLHAKIHTFNYIECDDEVSIILHSIVDKDNKCVTEVELINECFDEAEDNFMSIIDNEFKDKVEFNKDGLIEFDGEELTYFDWLDANFVNSLKWIAVDKFDTIHQYLIETKTIDYQEVSEEEWCEMKEDDINGLLELFMLYQEMGYEWMINNPSEIHPMLNYWLSLISKEEFESYITDYQQKSSAFFDREEEDETFDAIEASNEVLHEILLSILAHR